jgi:hypothetical protein
MYGILVKRPYDYNALKLSAFFKEFSLGEGRGGEGRGG